MKRTIALPVAAWLLVACAPPTQHTYIAPSRETVVSTTEVHDANPPTHLIYVENHSTVPVIVFAIMLTDCENVRMQCGARQMNTRLDAGGRSQVARIQPENRERAMGYRFSFSWRADTSYGTSVLTALAETGDSSARVRLAAMQHADSLRRAEEGPHFNELTKSDFSMIAGRVARMNAYPESLVIAPGERTSIERIRVLLLDNAGSVLGQTRWFRYQIGSGPVQFTPPVTLVGKRPGRTVIRFALADEAQKLLGAPVADLVYPVVVAYAPDPHAPTFEGLAVDADTKTPLACAAVALEDSAQNVVARSRTSEHGTFSLLSPRPGTYRVRVETPGWEPVFGPTELAKADEDRQHQYVVKFAERMLTPRYMRDPDEVEHARPVSMRMEASARKSIVSNVTLGGSEAMPILGIVGRAPVGTMWMQFVVDSTGQVDPKSITLPPGTDQRAVTSVTQVLPRVHFSPARDEGKPVCELLRMQVNFSNR